MKQDKLLLRSQLSIERLDKLAEVLNKDPAGKLELVFGLVKMVVALAYIYVRNKMVANEWEIQKQEYENSQKLDARTEINEEDMDGR